MSNSNTSYVKPIAIGAGAGLLNGLFGAGGGLLLVPLFTAWCKLEPKTAFATSLAVTLPLSIVSLCVYALRGGVDFLSALPYAIGGLLGGLLGGRWMKTVRVEWLRALLVLFLIYGGVKAVMLW